MSQNLSPQFERLAALLDPDERQSVLGDIQERGADLRALRGIIGLVALRQLQAWKSWRPWALAALLYYPAQSAGLLTNPVASILYSGHWLTYQRGFGTFIINPWALLAAPVFAWAAGFSLARLGQRRSASLLLLLPAVFAWNIYSVARFTFFGQDVPSIAPFTYFGPDAVQAARLAFLETGAFVLAMLLMLGIVVVPCLRGFRRGLRDRPLSPLFAIILLALFLPDLRMWIPPQNAGLRFAFVALASHWPLAYMLAASRRTPDRVIHNV